ncbi:4-hydroxythreonine-4-phosphate dehydrogenase PdxA [Carboxylicivirga linearis]|uniref:4-hydroxythreonine-4-phosphate dehydrogenase PdxA n=1 Tax=Carboxylicivirga linearis TaxID=1628157 RepID=A0ABS5JSI0_9BACT|nr:4-hydroxythreonine-4-phosphate dehydrogenase PdxA [Carboxylicivirga linearis]MBS2097763.1 4-hydroxythreonine-4-phosphate dehydrogenase PdxA [Carboxylicivirga linearis]
MSENKIKVGITHGDINGIGYEVIFKTLADNRIFESFIPVIYGSSKVAAYHRKALNIPNFSLNSIRNVDDAHNKRINIINCLDDNIRVELGKTTTIGGDAAFKALELAVTDLKEGKIDVLVTAPINKKNIQSESFNFPGHTEYLEQQAGDGKALMLMVSENMKVGVVAGHVALKDVPSKITKESILTKLRTLNETLVMDFSIRKPRIAVLGLNPHAGDQGVLGTEEQDIIIPALDEAKKEGIMALGPYPADGLFGSEQFKNFDAILAMYHDQGLAPFKALTFSKGVNYTAGLPFIRTSPDHGTAFEIAGQDKANFESFRQAVYLAIDVCHNRAENKELHKNPLKTHDLSELEGNE